MQTERRTSTGGLEVRGSSAAPELRGYAIVFNSRSVDLGGFKEIIRPEAVDRALRGADVRALVDHDTGKVIGRTTAGTLRLSKDSRGMPVRIFPPDTSAGRDVVTSVKRGDITGMSFSFRVPEGGDDLRREGGERIRYVHDMELLEVSLVAFPAYPTTEVDARSILARFGSVSRTTDYERWLRWWAVQGEL